MQTSDVQLGLLDQWEQDQEERERAEKARLRTERHIRDRRLCWPEWDGPKVGGFCQVDGIGTRREDGGTIYAYMEQCRLVEQRPDGSWLAVIEMGIVHGEPWRDDGVRLILDEIEIWPPTRQLWAARHAAEETEGRERSKQ